MGFLSDFLVVDVAASQGAQGTGLTVAKARQAATNSIPHKRNSMYEFVM